MMMTRLKHDLSRSGQCGRGVRRGSRLLIDEAAHDGSTHGTAHGLPGYGWAGVQDRSLGHAGDDVLGDADADDVGLGGQQMLDSCLIGGGDL